MNFRWLVPVAVVGVVAGTAAVVGAAGAAGAKLPERGAAQLLVDLSGAVARPVSGTVAVHADLGIPALPGLAGGDAADWTALLSGDHTLRVWYADPAHARVALTGRLAESDLVRNGSDLWTWSSRDNAVTHITLPDISDMSGKGGVLPGQPGASPRPLPSGFPHVFPPGATRPVPSGMPRLPGGLAMPTTPLEAAQDLIRLADPTTAITSGPTVTVAGRDAYQLVVTPKDAATLIGSIRVAIDGDTHVPLRVQVFAKGAAKPAFEIGYTQVSFATPAARVFAFTPPAGAKVTTPAPGAAAGPATIGGTRPQATVIGSGWSTVLGIRADLGALTGTGTPTRRGDLSIGNLIAQLPKVSGAWGSGHLIQTALVSVLVTDDGRLFVGAVPGARLLIDANSPQAALTAPTPSGTPHR